MSLVWERGSVGLPLRHSMSGASAAVQLVLQWSQQPETGFCKGPLRCARATFTVTGCLSAVTHQDTESILFHGLLVTDYYDYDNVLITTGLAAV